MKIYPFNTVRYIQSALAEDSFPTFLDERKKAVPEIAIVGRSNVGKSSLINHLFNQKKLARVSSVPGKTQTLNFFYVDEKLILVDLPGYGYAKVSKEKKENWAGHLETYFLKRDALKAILILLDVRHPPTPEDLAFISWAHHSDKTLVYIFTKCDQLKPHEVDTNVSANLKIIKNDVVGERPLNVVNYTIKESRCRKALIDQINKILASSNT